MSQLSSFGPNTAELPILDSTSSVRPHPSLSLSAQITDFDVSEFVHELIVVRSGRGDMTRAPILVPRAHSSGFQNVKYRSPEVILFYIYKGNYVCCLKEILHVLKFCRIQLFSQIINRIEICFSHGSALRVVSFWFSSVLWLRLESNNLIGQYLKLPNPSDIETSPYGNQPL